MSLVVREEGSVPIPEDLAQRFGIHEGSRIEWEITEDGRLNLRSEQTRREAIDRFCGSLKGHLKPGESAVADLILEREEDTIREEQA